MERVLIASLRDLISLAGEQHVVSLTASHIWFKGLIIESLSTSDVIQFDF